MTVKNDAYFNGQKAAHQALRKWDPKRHRVDCDCMSCETVRALADRLRQVPAARD